MSQETVFKLSQIPSRQKNIWVAEKLGWTLRGQSEICSEDRWEFLYVAIDPKGNRHGPYYKDQDVAKLNQYPDFVKDPAMMKPLLEYLLQMGWLAGYGDISHLFPLEKPMFNLTSSKDVDVWREDLADAVVDAFMIENGWEA